MVVSRGRCSAWWRVVSGFHVVYPESRKIATFRINAVDDRQNGDLHNRDASVVLGVGHGLGRLTAKTRHRSNVRVLSEWRIFRPIAVWSGVSCVGADLSGFQGMRESRWIISSYAGTNYNSFHDADEISPCWWGCPFQRMCEPTILTNIQIFPKCL